MSNVTGEPAQSGPSEERPGPSTAGLTSASDDPQTSQPSQMSRKRSASQMKIIRKYHTQMIVELGDMFRQNKFCSICDRVEMMGYVKTRDMDKVKSMEKLCMALRRKGIIQYGEYSDLRDILVDFDVKAGEIIDMFTKKILEEKEGPSPAKQTRMSDPDQQQSTEILPELKNMIETAKARIKNEREKKKFYPTKGFSDAKDKLQQKRVVVIKGNTGDGKTAIAIQLIHWLQEQQAGQPLQIHNIEKLSLLAPNLKLITFIDDIFGEKEVYEKDVGEWKKRISDSIETNFVGEKATNFLVITIRNEVYNSLDTRSRKTILTDDHIIDLSSNTYKIEEEKKELLELYKPKNLSWSDKEKDQIVKCAPNIGFPQCCHLFYNSVELQKKPVEFFENPFDFLNEVLSNLQERSALLYLFFNDGKIRVKDLGSNSQNVNEKLLDEAFDISGQYGSSKLAYKEKVSFVKKSLETLLGFLVVKEEDLLCNEDLVMTGKSRSYEDVYRFHHDSICVAVALLYGKATTVGYIQNCHSKYLSYLTTSETATNMIVISSDHYTEMLERLLREFVCKECYYRSSVGSLDVWKDPVFVERFVGLLNERKVDKLAVLNKACRYGAEECALYLLSEGVIPNKYTDLWSLVYRHRNDGNKQLCLLKEIVVYMNNEKKLDVLNGACGSGAEECALYLLSEGVKPDKDTNLWSLVYRHRNDGNKQLCLLKKIVVYMNDETKLGVLNKACWSGAEECVLYLLCEERAEPDENTALPLVSTHWNDGNKQLCLLKEIAVYMNDETKLAVLNGACEFGAEECALYLLSEGVKPDEDTDLWSLVSRHWNDGNKQLCLLKKIVVYMNDETKLDVLNEACESGAEECALYLLCEERVEPDKDTVFIVVEGGSIELLRKLLEYDVTRTVWGGLYGGNVLHEACWWGREEMVTLLYNTYPHLVHDTNELGQTPLHYVAERGNLGLFQMMERFVLNSLYRVENQQTKCESGCVVHKYCVCAQYMSQLVDDIGGTVLHWSCGGGGSGGVNREVCLYLCRSYPGLIPMVDKDGWHCLHYIAWNTSDVDVFTECETYVKQYVESTGGQYDVTTILDNGGTSVLDKAKERAKYWGSGNNPLLEHLVSQSVW